MYEEDEGELPANERLTKIWQEGRRAAVVSFLKRAITPDASLQDVFDALSFPEAMEHLQTLRLQEILGNQARKGAEPPRSKHVSHPHAKRDPETTQQMRGRLVDYLAESEAGRATTSELWAAMRDEGLASAQVAVINLIKGLEADGLVENCGGTPIVWKLTR